MLSGGQELADLDSAPDPPQGVSLGGSFSSQTSFHGNRASQGCGFSSCCCYVYMHCIDPIFWVPVKR